MIERIGTHLGVKTVYLAGGISLPIDIQKLKDGCHVICGSPGRTLDQMKRGHLQVRRIKVLKRPSLMTPKMVIVDDADEVLNRGFNDHLVEIIPWIFNNERRPQLIACSRFTLGRICV